MKNLSVIVTLALFLIGIVMGYGQLQAKAENTSKKVEVLEERIDKVDEEKDKELDEIKDENNETQKVMVEQNVKLQYIQSLLEKIDKKLEQ